MCICIYIYIHVHVHVHRDHGGVCWGCVGKSGFQWKHVYGRVFPGVFGIANSLQNVAHSQKLWSLSGRSVGTVSTWLGGNGVCSSWCSRQPAWWHGCYRKEQFCGFQIKESCSKTTKKNTQFVGVQTTKKKRFCGVPNGDSGKPPPKSILITICEVFGGLLHPPYLYLAFFI